MPKSAGPRLVPSARNLPSSADHAGSGPDRLNAEDAEGSKLPIRPLVSPWLAFCEKGLGPIRRTEGKPRPNQAHLTRRRGVAEHTCQGVSRSATAAWVAGQYPGSSHRTRSLDRHAKGMAPLLDARRPQVAFLRSSVKNSVDRGCPGRDRPRPFWLLFRLGSGTSKPTFPPSPAFLLPRSGGSTRRGRGLPPVK